ncbi:amidase [Nocardia sp. NBC_01503]|uniref:amidase n=1 Tax=Nocardia sp. NBC_01503 TaxID=2975997 RepID=UPI002E7AC6A0|nr:amidase [Nocardia sp. NBC_01503]WTL31336.1 amidase [Nocardia sp. NBC_01503]
MLDSRLDAYADDALGHHDAVGAAAAVHAGITTPAELAAAAAARAQKVDPALNAVAYAEFATPRYGEDESAALYGVPTFVKDNTDVRGMPSNHGTTAFRARPARGDGVFTRQFRSTGMTVLGKSRLPEFGFSPTTEFMSAEPARNPWNTEYSVGASSGGAAALVAAGVVPIAHANDGGGSIRIPAACAGLVGLKPSRGRHVDGEMARMMPINLVSEGVLTRTVRDTAAYIAAMEDFRRNPALPPIGAVLGPARRRLRIGLVTDTLVGEPVDAETTAAVEYTAALLEHAGHKVEPVRLPVTRQWADDFVQLWALLADLIGTAGRLTFDRSFDTGEFDGLTKGLRSHHRANLHRTPTALWRLRGTADAVAGMFAKHELILSPVLCHTTPKLGYLSPTIEFDELLTRLMNYVGFTPINNVAGTPAISLPMGMSGAGMPIGVQLSAAYGDERTLLESAFELEAAHRFPSTARRPIR